MCIYITCIDKTLLHIWIESSTCNSVENPRAHQVTKVPVPRAWYHYDLELKRRWKTKMLGLDWKSIEVVIW